jgi:hypothetical protein
MQKVIVIDNFIKLSILCSKRRGILNYFLRIKTLFTIINQI